MGPPARPPKTFTNPDMTEDTEQQPASATDGELQPAEPPTAAKKPAPRRKATRVVKSATAVPSGESGSNGVDANDGEAAPVIKKVRRPRKVVPVENEQAATSTSQPAMFSNEAMEKLSDPEAHVETQVISPSAFDAIERKAKQIFHPDGNARSVPAGPALHPATPAPAAPPPAAEAQPAPASVEPASVPEAPIIGPSTAEIPPSPTPPPQPPATDGNRAPQPFQGRGDQRPFERQQGQGGGQGYGRHEGRQDRFERRDNRYGQGQGQGQPYGDRQPQGQGGQFNRHQQQGGGNRQPQTDGDRRRSRTGPTAESTG